MNLICATHQAKLLDDIVVVSELGSRRRPATSPSCSPLPGDRREASPRQRRPHRGDEHHRRRRRQDGRHHRRRDRHRRLAIEAVGALQAAGATAIYSCAIHGLFSGSALERIAASPLTEVIVTDTIPLPPEADDPRITVSALPPARRGDQAHPPARASAPCSAPRSDGRGDDLLGPGGRWRRESIPEAERFR